MEDRPHVLIVEDDPGVRDALADLLDAEGYAIDLATNGAEAITCLETAYLRGDVRFASVPIPLGPTARETAKSS